MEFVDEIVVIKQKGGNDPLKLSKCIMEYK